MASTSLVESERKFDVKEGTELPRLKDLPGVAQVDKPEQQLLEAEYFDTEDLRLTRQQITLRPPDRWQRRRLAPETARR